MFIDLVKAIILIYACVFTVIWIIGIVSDLTKEKRTPILIATIVGWFGVAVSVFHSLQ